MTSATRRISIVGASGSGKSQLSRAVSVQTALPLHELDHIRDETGHELLTREDFIGCVSEIAERDDWIIDGHFRDVRQIVWSRAQAVIWLNYPVSLVIWRLLRRALRRKLATGWTGKRPVNQITGSEGWPIVQPMTSASWRKRWIRLANNLREQREYRKLLGPENCFGIELVELTSISKTDQWLANLASGRQSPHGSPPGIVCLFGLPGAGKTTLINALEPGSSYQSRLEIADKWHKLSGFRKLGFAMQAFADWPLLRAAVRFVVALRLFKPECIWRLIRTMIMKHWWRSNSGILLFDQGAIQNIWSILYASGHTNPDPALIAQLIKSVFEGVEAQIILIDVDAELSASRIGERSEGSSRFDGLQYANVVGRVATAAGIINAIAAAIPIAGVKLITLDGSKPVAALAEQLDELLTNFGKSEVDAA